MNKNERGITLIALIITVIVLLILAGTAISIAINGGDLFGKAQEAGESWNAAVSKEQSEINKFLNILSKTSLLNLPDNWDSSQLSSIVTGKIIVDEVEREVSAPIPTGYVASDIETEDEIVEGLVIYEGTETVSEDEDALTTRNQYVWIPVYDINSMVMCRQNAVNSKCNIVKQADGSLKCMTHHADDNDTILCSRLYPGTQENITGTESEDWVYSFTLDFTKDDQVYSLTTGDNEPAVLVGDSGKRYDAANGNFHGFGSGAEGAELFLAHLQGEFNKMAESVATYGGFYIGRYEIGYNSGTFTCKKGQVVLDVLEREDQNTETWYYMYSLLNTTKGTLNSQMLWGCQHQHTIKFIKENRTFEELDPEIAHLDIGLTNVKAVSGAEGVRDIMKNVYDLEGNYRELTALASVPNYRRGIGGSFDEIRFHGYNPASFEKVDIPNNPYNKYSSRPGLYLKTANQTHN